MTGSGLLALVAGGGLLALTAELPQAHWQLLLWTLNAASAGAYAWDKHRAQLGGTRVPELLLHSLALLGGAGACMARHWTRHKTLKAAFGLSTLLGTLVLWAGAFWLAA